MAMISLYNVSTTGKRYDNLDPPQPWYGASSSDQALHYSARSVDRNKTPNYRTLRLLKKRVPPLPYESRSARDTYPQGWVRVQVAGQPYAQLISGVLNENLMNNMLTRGHAFVNWNDLDGQVAKEYNLALQKCRLKFKSEAAELGAGLIQLGQTKSLFVDTTLGLGRLAMGVRAKNVKQCREAISDLFSKQAANAGISNPNMLAKFKRQKFLKNKKALRKAERKLVRKGVDATGSFLAYSFGWAPLMSDMDNAINQLALYNVQSDYRVTHRSRMNTTSKLSGYQIGEQNSAYGTATSVKEVGVQVIISALPTYHSLLLAQGLGLANPPAFAWEVVPFSFLLDYVVNVGGWLNSFDALLGYDGCETIVTRKFRITYTGKNDPPSTRITNGNTATYSASYSLSRVLKQMRRDVSYGQPPFVERPSYGRMFQVEGRVATTLAVAVQQLWKLNK